MFRYLTNLLLLTILLSGCSYEYHIKDEGIVAQQRQLFNQLCKARERSIIYQTAEVEGYLSASRGGASCQNGWDPIFKYGYHYAECTENSVTNHELPNNAEIYHFSLENEGHPGCGTGERHFVGYSRRGYHGNSPSYKETNRGDNYKKKHQNKLKGKCLVVKKIDKPMSHYMQLHSLSYYDETEKLFSDELYKKYKGYESRRKKGLISSSDVQIIDIRTGEILSQNSNYTFFPKGRTYSYETALYCKERKYIPPNDVLIPNINNN